MNQIPEGIYCKNCPCSSVAEDHRVICALYGTVLWPDNDDDEFVKTKLCLERKPRIVEADND